MAQTKTLRKEGNQRIVQCGTRAIWEEKKGSKWMVVGAYFTSDKPGMDKLFREFDMAKKNPAPAALEAALKRFAKASKAQNDAVDKYGFNSSEADGKRVLTRRALENMEREADKAKAELEKNPGRGFDERTGRPGSMGKTRTDLDMVASGQWTKLGKRHFRHVSGVELKTTKVRGRQGHGRWVSDSRRSQGWDFL